MSDKQNIFNSCDFTEAIYIKLLEAMCRNWDFKSFDECEQDGVYVLWRHDIDLSVHRALRLAEIESEVGVKATYFLNPHSEFYNLFELEISKKVFQIIDYGHDLGLHYDSLYFTDRLVGGNELYTNLEMEKDLLEKFFGVKIKAFSLHNPTSEELSDLKQSIVAGMINTYSDYLKREFIYVSDSNGYWRFDSLRDIMTKNKDAKLHVLTHPGWWVERPLSPRKRVQRAIDGRAGKLSSKYDQWLVDMGRENIR